MTDSERIKKMQNYTKASQVPEQGYCVVESVYDEQEYELIRTIFKELCHIKEGGFLTNNRQLVFIHS